MAITTSSSTSATNWFSVRHPDGLIWRARAVLIIRNIILTLNVLQKVRIKSWSALFRAYLNNESFLWWFQEKSLARTIIMSSRPVFLFELSKKQEYFDIEKVDWREEYSLIPSLKFNTFYTWKDNLNCKIYLILDLRLFFSKLVSTSSWLTELEAIVQNLSP